MRAHGPVLRTGDTHAMLLQHSHSTLQHPCNAFTTLLQRLIRSYSKPVHTGRGARFSGKCCILSAFCWIQPFQRRRGCGRGAQAPSDSWALYEHVCVRSRPSQRLEGLDSRVRRNDDGGDWIPAQGRNDARANRVMAGMTEVGASRARAGRVHPALHCVDVYEPSGSLHERSRAPTWSSPSGSSG